MGKPALRTGEGDRSQDASNAIGDSCNKEGKRRKST